MATYTEHQQEVARRGSVDLGGEAKSVIQTGINNAYKRVLAETFQDLRQRSFTVATVASQATLGLPLDVRTILDIQDTTDRSNLEEMTVEEHDKLDPGRVETGRPLRYFSIGRFGLQVPIAATSTISVESSSASDSTNLFVRMTFYDANGMRTSENLTLNGTTPAVSTGSADPSQSRGIERFTKYNASGATFAGNVICKDVTAGVVVARIPVAYDSPTYTWIEFDQIPSTAINLQIRAMVTKPDLINDNDWPEFDDQYHDILTLLGAGEVLPLFGKQDLATQYLGMGNQRLQEFKNHLDVKPNITHVLDNVQMTVPGGRIGQPVRGIDFGRVV